MCEQEVVDLAVEQGRSVDAAEDGGVDGGAVENGSVVRHAASSRISG